MQSVQSAEVPYRSGSTLLRYLTDPGHLMLPSLYYRYVICSCFRLHLWNPLSLSPYIFAQKPHLIRDIIAYTPLHVLLLLQVLCPTSQRIPNPQLIFKKSFCFQEFRGTLKDFPGFNANSDAEALYNAMKGFGKEPCLTLIPILAFCI